MNKHITVNEKIGDREDIVDFLKSNSPLENLFNLQTELSEDRIELYKKGYFGIGDTPCYKIRLPNDNRLYIKMEYANSMGNTHYSRFWFIYLFIAETLGVINPMDSNILEVTSGSSGIALSMAAELLGFNVTILVPSRLPEKRIEPMRRETTKIIKVEGYVNDCINELRKMIKRGNYYATNHSEEKADIITYVFSRIGNEIIKEKINPDYAVIGMGNGTSTLGIAKVLKENSPQTKIISYRPRFEEEPDDIVLGLIAANIDCRHVPIAENFVDEMKFTTGISLQKIREQFKYDTEICNLGYSSLYGLYYSLKLAVSVKNKRIVSVGYDKIDRY